MSKYADLKLLDELREKGSITEEEFQREKAKILNAPPPPPPNYSAFGVGIDDRLYTIIMHLSQFVTAIIIPLIMWILGKDRSSVIDQHGKNIINFWISYLIYFAIATILVVVLIGIPLLVVLGIVVFVSIVIATIKAANGEAWRYPFTIEFIK